LLAAYFGSRPGQIDAELLYPRLKRGALETQAGSGPLRTSEHPVALVQRAENRLALRRLERGSAARRRDVSDVYRKAEERSGRHAASTGCRSLDILHVAGAVVLGVRDFVTFDARQGKLARKARLRVLPATA